jgi:uncharacterized caspase-like protein
VLTQDAASKANIEESFAWLDQMAKSKDLAVIYVRTRGTFAQLDPQGNNYLAASDTDPKSIKSTAIQMENLMEILPKRIHAHTIVLIPDADFSDVILRGHTEPSLPSLDLVQPGRALLVIPSADVNQIAWECDAYKSSVFTHNLIKALRRDGPSAMLLESAETIRKPIKDDVARVMPHRTQDIETCGLYRDGCDDVRLAAPATRSRSVEGAGQI